LRQVIDEILRVRPPAWTLGRDVAGDDTIGGFRVHKGEMVSPIVYLTHRHPDFWPDPERFDPERFTPARVESRHRYAYAPFSAGPRMCIGNLFTLCEAQIILAMMLQRCDFELATERAIPMKPMMTLRPGAPVPLRLRWK
jgi:cytochrome P450